MKTLLLLLIASNAAWAVPNWHKVNPDSSLDCSTAYAMREFCGAGCVSRENTADCEILRVTNGLVVVDPAKAQAKADKAAADSADARAKADAKIARKIRSGLLKGKTRSKAESEELLDLLADEVFGD